MPLPRNKLAKNTQAHQRSAKQEPLKVRSEFEGTLQKKHGLNQLNLREVSFVTTTGKVVEIEKATVMANMKSNAYYIYGKPKCDPAVEHETTRMARERDERNKKEEDEKKKEETANAANTVASTTTSTETTVVTPVETPVTTTAETTAETPVVTPAETPVTTSTETTVVTPAETPVSTTTDTTVVTPVTTSNEKEAPVVDLPNPEELPKDPKFIFGEQVLNLITQEPVYSGGTTNKKKNKFERRLYDDLKSFTPKPIPKFRYVDFKKDSTNFVLDNVVVYELPFGNVDEKHYFVSGNIEYKRSLLDKIDPKLSALATSSEYADFMKRIEELQKKRAANPDLNMDEDLDDLIGSMPKKTNTHNHDHDDEPPTLANSVQPTETQETSTTPLETSTTPIETSTTPIETSTTPTETSTTPLVTPVVQQD